MLVTATAVVVPAQATEGASAARTPLDAEFDTIGRGEFAGAANFSIQSPGLLAEWRQPMPGLSVTFSLQEARVRVVNAPYENIHVRQNDTVDYSRQQPLPPETEIHKTVTGTLRSTSSGPNSSVRILPLATDGYIPVRVENASHTHIHPPDHTRLPDLAYPVYLLNPARPLAPSGTFGTIAANGDIKPIAQQPVAILLWGGTFTLDDGEETTVVHAGEREKSPPLVNPPNGLVQVRHVDRRAILIEGLAAVNLTTPAAAPWSVTFGTYQADLAGSFWILEPNGKARINSETIAVRGAQFHAAGDFQFEGQAHDEDYTSLQVQGEATYITSHGRIIASETSERPEVLVGTGIVLLALLFLAHWLRDFFAGLLGRTLKDPTEHPIRAKAIELANERPGFTQRAFADHAGISPRLARYHLSVLTATGHLKVMTVQGAHAFIPNGSHHARPPKDADPAETPSHGDRVDPRLNALLEHDKRRIIYEAAASAGQADYETMARWWRSQGLPSNQAPSRRDVSYHGGILEATGLLLRIKKGRRVYWSPSSNLTIS